nr:hypothetical protein [Tanacetum cinerariifolium]
ELLDGGSPRVIVYGYDGLPMIPIAPPSPDYIPGLEEPQTPPSPQDEDEHELMFIQPCDPDFIPEPIYTEYIPLEDEHILPAEEQPLPLVVSPTAESPGYVAESDPKEDPEEYEEDEAEDGPDEDNEDEEEEHLAPADSAVVIPIDELVSPPEGIEPTIPSPSTDTTTIRARITIRPQTSISLPPEAEVKRLLAMPTPPPSPLTSLSPPSAREHLARCTTPAALPSPLLPLSSYPPPPVDRRDGIPEFEHPPRKRLCLSTIGSREVGYGIRDTWIDPTEAVPGMASTTLEKLHETHSQMQQTEMAGLRETDRVRQSQMVETLRVMRDMRREMGDMKAELLALRRQPRRARQPGEDARVLNHQDAPRDANKSMQAMIDQALLRNSTNGDGSQSSYEDNPRHVQTTRPCFYANFMKCHPLNFKGNKGVVGLTRWIEKMEFVFNIRGCAIENQVKFSTCTLLDAALTWWNGQIRTLGPEAYAMTWEFVANENEKIDKYISGLSDNIYGNVKSSKPRTLDETIELTNDLMDQKLCTYAERADHKRKTDDTSRNNHGHQQQTFKKKNVAKVNNMGMGDRKPYEGSLPKCTKCQSHHNGPCTQKCHKCNKVGHFARDCRSSSNANVANAQRDGKETPKGNGCFKCGASGHFNRDCPKLKNKNMGNRNAQGWVYAVGNAKKNRNAPMNPDSNVVTGTFLLSNRYACILFDTGADRSFISIAFSSLVNINPTPLGSSYGVELADGKIVGIDTIIRGCTINFLNHPFNIDLMLVELGSFDVIIGMDWLRRCHAVIVCDEKLVQIPYGNETLTFAATKVTMGESLD